MFIGRFKINHKIGGIAMLRLKRKFKLYVNELLDIPYPMYALMAVILVMSIILTKGVL